MNSAFTTGAETRFDYKRIPGVGNKRHVTQEFLNEVERLAQRLGTRPEYLQAVMSFETGGTFDPAATIIRSRPAAEISRSTRTF